MLRGAGFIQSQDRDITTKILLPLFTTSLLAALGLPLCAQQAAPPASPLDQPLAWLQEGRKNFSNVRDYSCTLVKRERVGNTLQDENIILLSYRAQPYSIYMKWLGPHNFRGQEVCYVHGRNNNKMRVHAKGLIKNAVGFVSVAPDDRRVMKHSRHTIYEAGIGSLLEQSYQNLQNEKKFNKTVVNTAEYTFDKKLCLRVETTRTERQPSFYCYRSILYLDKETKLPVRAENYDWPHAGGPAGGELLESFSFIDFRYNVNIPEAVFEK